MQNREIVKVLQHAIDSLELANTRLGLLKAHVNEIERARIKEPISKTINMLNKTQVLLVNEEISLMEDKNV